MFIRYHFQDGAYSISSSFDKCSDFTFGSFTGMQVIYIHPSTHLDSYIEKYDKKMQSLFKSLGLRNGVITLQGFVDRNNEFYCYEDGYRLGGSQSYIFTDAVNSSNSLHYMINYALTGSMADYSIAKRDKPHFTRSCCNQYMILMSKVHFPGFGYNILSSKSETNTICCCTKDGNGLSTPSTYIPLKPGVITRMEGSLSQSSWNLKKRKNVKCDLKNLVMRIPV